MGSAHSITEHIKERDCQDAQRERERTSTTTTSAPSMVFEDDADLSVHKANHESQDVYFDQSNHGFSFVNIHWASFSMGLSSVLAVLFALILIVGCCYFRGRRQRQSRARHTELLCTIVAGATKNVSTPQCSQFGAYPGPPSSVLRSSDPSPATDDRIVFEPTLAPSQGAVAHPVVRYTPVSASCGLPSCSTTYSRPHSHSVSHLPLAYKDAHSASSASHLPSAPPAIEYQPEPIRSTGIHSLGR